MYKMEVTKRNSSKEQVRFDKISNRLRILCNLFGNDVENGLLPNDMDLISQVVEDICYNNAKNYFSF